MHKLEIKTLASINGINFGSTRIEVRKHFGSNFEEFPKKLKETPEEKKEYDEIVKRMAQMSGKTVEDFLKGVPDLPPEIFDDYSFAMFNYNNDFNLESVEIPSDKKVKLIVDGIDISNFELKKIKTLADDFVSEENNTAWTSYSKQIGIYCPDGDDRVECILFGGEGYYGKD